jgi:GGDEF domain-containing protein
MAPLVEDDSPKPALSRRGFRLPGGPLDDTVGQPAPPLTPPVVRVPPAPALPQFSQPVIPAGTDIFVRTTTAEHTQSGTAPAFEQTASQQNMPPFLPPVPVLQPQSAPETAAVLGPAPDTAASRGPKQLPSPVELDRAAVDGVWGELTNAETGLLTQPAFLFFLVNEVQRHAQTQHPFAIVRFEMCVRYSGTETVLKPLPKRAVREAARRIFAQMRPLSLVGHYRETDYAFLLPLANREQATEFINQVHKNLMSGPLVQGMEVENLALFFGIASMPDDCNHPGVLLAAADEALTAAKSTNKTIVTYAEL